jgi:methylenetetrahydrofolate dehydrogenase (NADP+)/methenyltetrahydrofolate cyclohydrolase
MTATVFDGKALAARIKRSTADQVRALNGQGVGVRLDGIVVGDPEVGLIFAQSQERQCREVGIQYELHRLPGTSTQDEITSEINRLNADPQVTGIVLNLPLPPGIDAPAVQYVIDPYKDIEGVSPANVGMLFYDCPIMAPCTSVAVLEILREIGFTVRGTEATVIGMGAITGRPMILNLMQQDATVTACNVHTQDLARHTRHADLLIATAGVPGLIGAEHVKPGAVVIDVGVSRVPDGSGGSGFSIVGDVRFDEVREVADVITPVPGGVGPVTVAVAVRAATEAARRQLGPRRIGP